MREPGSGLPAQYVADAFAFLLFVRIEWPCISMGERLESAAPREAGLTTLTNATAQVTRKGRIAQVGSS